MILGWREEAKRSSSFGFGLSNGLVMTNAILVTVQTHTMIRALFCVHEN
jgi:hypothetical protein